MKRIFRTAFVFCLILFFVNAPLASADTWPPPIPFYTYSEDGNRVFHVTPDDWGWSQFMGANFPPTGLYYSTIPRTLIYLVDFPCSVLFESNFIFSSDMQYFVWFPEMNVVRGFENRDATAMVFYANGTAQKTYMVSDLVSDLDKVSWTVSMGWWIYHSGNHWWQSSDTETDCSEDCLCYHLEGWGRIFDPKTNWLTILTVEHETFVFDITTGEIIDPLTAVPNPPANLPTAPEEDESAAAVISWLGFFVVFISVILVFFGSIAVMGMKRKRD